LLSGVFAKTLTVKFHNQDKVQMSTQ